MMMTRREVLAELNRMGVTRLSLLKSYLRDFEKYIGSYYDLQILRTKKTSQRDLSPATLEFAESTWRKSSA
jgi:hypothetical protein